jgi:hypothetical protein
MKLVRYGDMGAEKPGMLDADGNLRDLSAHVDDITGAVLDDATLDRLRGVDPASLPLVEGNPRIGACVGGIGKFLCIGLNYVRSRRRNWCCRSPSIRSCSSRRTRPSSGRTTIW